MLRGLNTRPFNQPPHPIQTRRSLTPPSTVVPTALKTRSSTSPPPPPSSSCSPPPTPFLPATPTTCTPTSGVSESPRGAMRWLRRHLRRALAATWMDWQGSRRCWLGRPLTMSLVRLSEWDWGAEWGVGCVSCCLLLCSDSHASVPTLLKPCLPALIRTTSQGLRFGRPAEAVPAPPGCTRDGPQAHQHQQQQQAAGAGYRPAAERTGSAGGAGRSLLGWSGAWWLWMRPAGCRDGVCCDVWVAWVGASASSQLHPTPAVQRGLDRQAG